ncbi:MAG: beta-N-acetylhexosaminidase, partial [Bacteroidota bacterium]|nr:beta-N-acetylhexosaminidase [Bacteroidota bacterium]
MKTKFRFLRMKHYCSYLVVLMFLSVCGMSASAQNASGQKIQVVPMPVKEKVNAGAFTLTSDVKIIIPDGNKEVETTAQLFSEQVSASTGLSLKKIGSAGTNGKSIRLILNKVQNNAIGTEGYVLNVKPSGITINANKPAGLFYGVQTLIQLLPSETGQGGKINSKSWNIPCTEITDYPRFGWRGLMLDVSRHFFTKEFVKRYIDQMAKYKMNVFHWHLTDNQGWRIEIKGFPELTRVGAWRVPRTGRFWTFEAPQPGEKATDGGYYTQEDIKEVVSYAQKRFVTIVPEVDVPGHSLAFIASYPEASCTHAKYAVNAGFPHGDEDLVLCVGNEDNFKKLETIFSEVAALFPGKYIHIGGDEANKDNWKKCPLCQKRMKDEGLKNEEQLQSYFIKRLEKILASKGKKLIG